MQVSDLEDRVFARTTYLLLPLGVVVEPRGPISSRESWVADNLAQDKEFVRQTHRMTVSFFFTVTHHSCTRINGLGHISLYPDSVSYPLMSDGLRWIITVLGSFA